MTIITMYTITINQENIADSIKTIIQTIQSGVTITAQIPVVGDKALDRIQKAYEEAVSSPSYTLDDALSQLKS